MSKPRLACAAHWTGAPRSALKIGGRKSTGQSAYSYRTSTASPTHGENLVCYYFQDLYPSSKSDLVGIGPQSWRPLL